MHDKQPLLLRYTKESYPIHRSRRTVSGVDLGLDAARFSQQDRGVRVVLLHRGICPGKEGPE